MLDEIFEFCLKVTAIVGMIMMWLLFGLFITYIFN